MSISEYPPLVQWIKGLSMFTQKACSATRKTASIKSRKQGQAAIHTQATIKPCRQPLHATEPHVRVKHELIQNIVPF